MALLAVVALAVLLRQALLTRSLWFDEGYSLDVARRTLPQIWAFLRTNDSHPIGYYAFLSMWIRWAGTGLIQIRAPSLVFGLAAVVLTWRIGRELFSPAVGVVAAALVAVNPFQILASDEARMYPLLECLGLVATWILWRASRPEARAWWWVGYGGVAALLLYTSYYAVLLLCAQVLWVAGSRPWRAALTRLGIAGVVALALYAPWIPVIVTLPDRLPLPWRQPITPAFVTDLVATQTFGGYVFHLGTYQTVGGPALHYHPLLLFPFLALLAAGAFVLGRINAPARTLIGVSWAAPLVLVVAASLATGHMAAFPRHLVFLQPFAALLLAAGIVHLRDAVAAAPGAVVPLLAAVLVLTFVYPAVDEAETNPQLQNFRYDLAARFVKDLYKPGDAVLFFPAEISKPFRYYFDPPNRRMYLDVDLHRWTRTVLASPIRQATETLVTHHVERVWLVYSQPWPPGALDDLEHALTGAGFQQGPVEDFADVWVTLFIHPQHP